MIRTLRKFRNKYSEKVDGLIDTAELAYKYKMDFKVDMGSILSMEHYVELIGNLDKAIEDVYDEADRVSENGENGEKKRKISNIHDIIKIQEAQLNSSKEILRNLTI